MAWSWTNDTERGNHNDTTIDPLYPDNAKAPTIFVAEAGPLSQYLSKQLESTSAPNDLLAQISLADDVPEMMADVAMSMSAALVNNGRDTDNVQDGVSWATVPISRSTGDGLPFI